MFVNRIPRSPNADYRWAKKPVRAAAWAAALAGALAQPALSSDSAPAEPSAQEPAPTPTKPQDDALDVEAILSNPLDDEAYRERKTCLHLRAIDRVEVLDDTMVLFHVRRGKAWLNQFSSRCLGLHDDMIINLTSFGSSICRLDAIRGVSRLGDFGIEARCRLGDFEFIDQAQIEALRGALAERRNAADTARKTRRAARKARRAAKRRGGSS